jgi:hypothetical protein
MAMKNQQDISGMSGELIKRCPIAANILYAGRGYSYSVADVVRIGGDVTYGGLIMVHCNLLGRS